MKILLAILLALWLLWALYVFTMGIYRAHLTGRLGKVNKALASPIVLCAVAFDAAVNYSIASVLFWEWPERGEYTLTKRLHRYIGGIGWRASVAEYICDHVLDPFDPTGDHC